MSLLHGEYSGSIPLSSSILGEAAKFSWVSIKLLHSTDNREKKESYLHLRPIYVLGVCNGSIPEEGGSGSIPD